MTVLEPIAEQSAALDEVSRVLEHGPVQLTSAEGEHVDLPAPLQEMLRAIVRLVQAGQAVTLYPAMADPKAIERPGRLGGKLWVADPRDDE